MENKGNTTNIVASAGGSVAEGIQGTGDAYNLVGADACVVCVCASSTSISVVRNGSKITKTNKKREERVTHLGRSEMDGSDKREKP